MIFTVEIMTLGKYVTEYEQMRKWIVESLGKFHDNCIKITEVDSIRVTKPIHFLLYLTYHSSANDAIMSHHCF